MRRRTAREDWQADACLLMSAVCAARLSSAGRAAVGQVVKAEDAGQKRSQRVRGIPASAVGRSLVESPPEERDAPE